MALKREAEVLPVEVVGTSGGWVTPSKGRACVPFLFQNGCAIQPQHMQEVVEWLTSLLFPPPKPKLPGTAAISPSSFYFSSANLAIAMQTGNDDWVERFIYTVTEE